MVVFNSYVKLPEAATGSAPPQEGLGPGRRGLGAVHGKPKVCEPSSGESTVSFLLGSTA